MYTWCIKQLYLVILLCAFTPPDHCVRVHPADLLKIVEQAFLYYDSIPKKCYRRRAIIWVVCIGLQVYLTIFFIQESRIDSKCNTMIRTCGVICSFCLEDNLFPVTFLQTFQSFLYRWRTQKVIILLIDDLLSVFGE